MISSSKYAMCLLVNKVRDVRNVSTSLYVIDYIFLRLMSLFQQSSIYSKVMYEDVMDFWTGKFIIMIPLLFSVLECFCVSLYRFSDKANHY